ncbi:MAG: branched-chain amino acid ABC transporter permease [Dongiaceae bacterium]
MATFADLFSYVYQYLDNIGFLILASVGLILIFGMMGVINMAHGELMMVGAYITASTYYAGVPAPLAILLAGIGAGLVGMVLERLIIRHFYKQLLSSLVVTWGLSLMFSQGFLLLFGPSVLNVPTPLGGFAVGELSFGVYRLVLFAVSIGLIVMTWLLFAHTGFGVRARATMENPEMAEALGISTRQIYSLTFGLGSFLGGVAGGLFALTAAISPFFGLTYTPLAFITVVIGGSANVITGLVASALYLAGIQTVATNVFNQYFGYVLMMAGAFIVLLMLPTGISDWLERRRMRLLRGRGPAAEARDA